MMPISVFAAIHPVTKVRCSEGISVMKPVQIDQKDVNGKAFDVKSLLQVTVDRRLADQGETIATTKIPASQGLQVRLLQFGLESTTDTKVSIRVSGIKDYELWLDDEKISADSKTRLTPGSHRVYIKYLSGQAKDAVQKPSISYEADDEACVSLSTGTSRQLTLHDITDGRRPSTVALSPSGRYLITSYYDTQRGGKTTWSYRLTDLETRRVLQEGDRNISWMPRSEAYYYTEQGQRGRRLVSVSMQDGSQTVLAEGFPEGYFFLTPDEQALIIARPTKIPEDKGGVKNIQEPDDRQPGWRNRADLVRYDLKQKAAQPLTFGYSNVSPASVSEDGRYLLYMVSRSRLTQRPTTLSSIYRLDLQTLDTLCVVRNDGFLADAQFSPDGTKILVKGSPEAFGGIGKNLPEGRIPSMYDYQLFMVDVATGKTTPLTRDFNPSIETVDWNAGDGQIYFTALDRDYVRLYRLNPQDGRITQLDVPEDVVVRFATSRNGKRLAWTGEGATNSYRVYTMDLATGRNTVIDDCSAQLLQGIDLAECHPYTFSNGRGDSISARYYLPPHFDPAKKYPMIVNYYGGCSPTSRYFESRYPHQLYATMGYVVLVINPSGAAGFGQEFASRHVNTAGDEVADDIITGTRTFCREHAFVDSTKIGCIGASYGGFMTQYLQTKTDLFAAAVSHAGISDHTSYWGGGYWGYSYSEVSMAGSYPWTRRDLYVDHSPIYNVDKIHTPILFTHGTGDTNVPVLESIQMYTALKLLGRETALIEVDGENHWIQDYPKRYRWQAAIFAWFQKWLKGDDKWWKSL